MASLQSFYSRPHSSKLGRGRREEDFFVIPTSCRWRGFEGTNLATLAHLEHPKSADGILAILLLSTSLEQAQIRLFVKVLRREGDSNPRNPFGVYTLSRRASSTTRASLLVGMRLSHERRFSASLGDRDSSSILEPTRLSDGFHDYRYALVV